MKIVGYNTFSKQFRWPRLDCSTTLLDSLNICAEFDDDRGIIAGKMSLFRDRSLSCGDNLRDWEPRIP